jgi:hypothetical protein
MRVHNLLIKEKGLTKAEAQRETIFNWQSVVLHSHQASVLDPVIFQQVLKDLEAELAKPGHGPVKYRPSRPGGPLKLPHEFAIGFRYGHSQLRDRYYVSKEQSFPLFDNLLPGPGYGDLRGNRALTPDRAIDWPFFITPDQPEKRSNLLDTLITSVVFDLPESAVPDVPTKFLGNLPQRNLIRSHEIHLTSGEGLFDIFFGARAKGKLTPEQIEPVKEKRGLFHMRPGVEFETPLWYYILKEAELHGAPQQGGLRLGKLGSRLVGEVVAGGIYYNRNSYIHDTKWVSAINGSRTVTIKDLVDFIHDKDAT